MSAVQKDENFEALRAERLRELKAMAADSKASWATQEAAWAAEDAADNAAMLDAEIATLPGEEFLGRTLDAVVPEPVNWISHGRLAMGKITVIDGDPGQGKSTVTTDWGAKITRGLPLPDGPALPPAGVILMNAEDDPGDTIRPRADAAGADVSRILVLAERPDGSLLSIPNDLPLIEREVHRMAARLIVIDPLMAFLDPAINANRDQDVRRALAGLAAMAGRTGVAVLVVRHMTKAGGSNALYRGGGSIGVIGAARFGLIVGADPDDEGRFLIASSKCNLAKAPATLAYRLESVPGSDVARVAWDGTSTMNASALLMAADDRAQEDGDGDETRAWLADYLATGPKPSEEVWREARRLGHGEKAVKRAKKALKATATKEGFGQNGRWSWALPDHEVVENPSETKGADPTEASPLASLVPLRPSLQNPDPLSNGHTITPIHKDDDDELRGSKKAKEAKEAKVNGRDPLDPWDEPPRLLVLDPVSTCAGCGASIDTGQRFCAACDPRGM